MAASGHERAELLAKLSALLGPRHAATLMESLHPQPWSEVATKRDLDALRAEVKAQFDHLETTLDVRFAAVGDRLEALLRERIDAQTKLLVFSLVGAVLTAAGIAIGSAAL